MKPDEANLPEPVRADPESKYALGQAARPSSQLNGIGAQPWRGHVPALAMPPSSPADLGRHFRALRRRWGLALGLGLGLAGLAAVGAWFALGAKYTAFALVHVAASPPKFVFTNATTPDGRTDFPTYIRTQASRIRSRYVLSAALKRDEVKKLDLIDRETEPVAWLEDELKVDFKEGSEIITVAMTGPYPEELLALVNAVSHAYLQEVVNVELKRRTDQIAEVETVFNASREKLREKRNAVRRLSDQLGTSDSQALTQKQVIRLNSYGEVEKQYYQVHYDLMKARGKLTAFEGRLKGTAAPRLSEAALSQAINADAIAKETLALMSRLKQIIRDYELTANRPDEKGLLQAREKLAAAKTDLEDRKKELRVQLEERLQKQNKVDYEGYAAQLQDEIGPLAEQEKNLAAEVQRLREDIGKVGNSSTELEMLRIDIKQEELLNERIGQQLEALRIELRDPSRVSLYQEAALQKRDLKRQVVGAALAPLGTLFLVGFCISWWEGRSRRIQTVNEITGVGMRLVGAVPILPVAGRRRLISGSDEQTVYGPTFLESIDAIRTQLLRDAVVDGLKTVMVTSAVEGEAKTTLASHLANSLARAGRKTLLIDCDLRRPTVQLFFNLALQPGFSEVVLGEINVLDALQCTETGLYVLAAGQWDREVLRLLANEAAKPIFDDLKKNFEFIIIDSHPTLAANDSLVIGQNADAVILSLLRDRSQMHIVFAACQRLASLGIRVMGAVVNGIDQEELYDDFGHTVPRYPR